MKRIVLIIFIIIAINGCGSVNVSSIYKSSDNKKIATLANVLENLSHNNKESYELATLAVTYPRVLAKKYRLVSPPSYHNFLVNQGSRDRGLCYHWVEDLNKEIKSRHFKSFKFKWGQANANKLNEHNVLVVLPKSSSNFKNGIVLDAWRNSGEILFHKVKDDNEYNFLESKEGNDRLSR